MNPKLLLLSRRRSSDGVGGPNSNRSALSEDAGGVSSQLGFTVSTCTIRRAYIPGSEERTAGLAGLAGKIWQADVEGKKVCNIKSTT